MRSVKGLQRQAFPQTYIYTYIHTFATARICCERAHMQKEIGRYIATKMKCSSLGRATQIERSGNDVASILAMVYDMCLLTKVD